MINAEEHIQLWNAAAIKVIDVRHFSMMHGEELRSYLFPSSVFLYAIRGEAQVLLDGIEHTANRFHLWHGGKGTCLDIFPTEAEEAFNSYTEGKLDGVESIGDGIAYERILELQPDLIIVWNDPAVLDKLNQIAPTVVVDYGMPVRQQLLEFGKMTGREEQANAWITAWDKKIAEYKPKVQAAVGDKTVAIFDSGSAKEFYAYGNKLGRGGEIIYGEFQLKAPPIIQKEAIDSGTGWAKLSLELLPEYAGDYIFISEWTGNDNPEAIFEGSLWEQLDAVKNNRVFREEGRGFMFSDPVSLDAQLEFVVKSFIGK
ncbi:ABC transporter substrate-binding protein [Paenibacillus algorifonticola]|uniref:ABC transporter substrate-binding protein n=1 Tax=Paenibacillus algorifonticola TaxID=684063 RepID=UPI003D268CCE